MSEVDIEPSSALCPGRHRHDQKHHLDDGQNICPTCQKRLHHQLTQLAELHAACEIALLGSPSATTDKVRHKPQPGLNLNQNALNARTAIEAELHCWARIIIDERQLHKWPQPHLGHLGTWLAQQVDWISRQAWAPEMSRTINDTHREARAAAYPIPVRRFTIPDHTCPHPGCDGQIIAYIRDDADLLPSVLLCSVTPDDPADRHQWNTSEWMSLGRHLLRTGHHNLQARIIHNDHH
jgi:hypothetical protein